MRLLDILGSELDNSAHLLEMPNWMHAYPKNPQLPDHIDPQERRGYKKIASNNLVDVWFNKQSLDIAITPPGRPVTKNVGYVRLYGLSSFAGAGSYQVTKFAPAVVVTDVFLDPKYRGRGLGKFVYQSLLDRGYTIASATSVNPNSQGLWRSMVSDPAIHTWAMHPRGNTAYPLKDVRGRLEPQIGSGQEDVTFERSTWFASTTHNPLQVSEAYIDLPQTDQKRSFFSDHADLLMPVVKRLMKTAARPLVYKVWKSTPKAVLALAAVIKLNNAGDPHPFLTLTQLTDLDVPMVFIKRLAWDVGIRDIPGLGRDRPRLLPKMVMGEAKFIPTQGDQRHHHHRVGDDAVMVWMDPRVFLKQAPSMGGGYDPEKDEMVQHWAEWLRDGRPLDGLELGGEMGHDGRHRAWGAILAGVDRVPVYVEPDMAEFYVENDMAVLHESVGTKTVYHVTFARNLRAIQVQGLTPQIGRNSKAIGEKLPGVHVFFDWDSMVDAATNWDMDWHDEDNEDEELVVLTLTVPEDWVRAHWETFNSGTGIVTQRIPPDMITAVKRDF